MPEESKKSYNFKDFRLKIKRPSGVLLRPRLDRGWRNDSGSFSRQEFTLEMINDIIKSGSLEDIQQLSLFYYRTNGEYRNNIDYLAALPLYDTVVIPRTDNGKGSKTQIINAFEQACDFVEKLDVPNTFHHITHEWLLKGVYYGFLREKENKFIIQDLPLEYCRSRFKDYNNLNMLEFNITYFNRYKNDEILLYDTLKDYPLEIQRAWNLWSLNKIVDPWVLVPASSGGVCFKFAGDSTPLLLPSIIELKKLDDAISREEKRDDNELYKLLIQKMPIDNKGELVFQLDEVADIHASVAEMLRDIDTVDVLTTFGDTELESLQESSAATQSADRIEKYKKNAFDALGRSSIIFNADGSSTLSYSIKKDEALMTTYLNQYETWIKYHLNERFKRNGLSFDFEILPTTVFNRQDLISNYFRSAQYGYSKMYAGVAMGIKQRDQISLMDFENEFLKMSEKMIPLQSSYTTPGNVVASEENSAQKNTSKTSGTNLDNKGGRPELPDEQKSEKTQANIAAAG